jgi:DNA-binding MarR family transcriptional regulator
VTGPLTALEIDLDVARRSRVVTITPKGREAFRRTFGTT